MRMHRCGVVGLLALSGLLVAFEVEARPKHHPEKAEESPQILL